MAPTLPARKAGGRRAAPITSGKNLPIVEAQEIELEDGTKVNSSIFTLDSAVLKQIPRFSHRWTARIGTPIQL